MNIFTVLVILLGIGLIVVLATFISSRGRNKASDVKAMQYELNQSRQLIDLIDNAAYDHRELDPVLAPQVIDLIRGHKTHMARHTGNGNHLR